ncbi:two-component system sensor histidine kinase NtrB [Maridesulfovibrio sp.]|uniref:two-component system sensor histidine kinase NtrB n=1 Tax=unclassified Maridesulfovibrio TaxID=2794999 RepID=UPI003AFFF267
MKQEKSPSIALKIAAKYAIFGFLWILLSDKLLNLLIRDADIIQGIQTLKGWLYVLITAAIIYILVERYDRSVQKSQNDYRRLLENIADPIYLVDAQGNIIDINEAAVDTLGYSREELLKLGISDIAPKINQDEWLKTITRAAPDQRFIFESRHKRKNGRTYPVEVVACIFQEEDHKYCLGVSRDITQRIQTLELFVQQEKMNSLGGMAAGIAHEINNPLAAILGATQNIRNRIFNDSSKNLHIAEECSLNLETMREYLRKRDIVNMLSTISEAGGRASHIISSMLNFSYSGPRKLHTCSIAELLDESLDLIASDLSFCNTSRFSLISIKKEYTENPLPICCMRSEIQQVIMNLIKNASEAMAEKGYPDGEFPELVLRIKNKKNGIALEIEDNGPGIPQKRLKKIFEPFYTSKSVGMGTGLGLSISYFIITEQHKGTIDVSSIPGKGTKFTIRLPKDSCDCCEI